ncbi:MAG: aminomethyl-transferring glycine dehydrogenase subunit GcvPA [Sinobacteraceae bacterium]|nr:aminomethyl-transferring glycine dehydrogenase subunit GcvPA [Nevskiaceae bacterium]
MPFIPHTEADAREMLGAIGVPNLAALFDEIPAELLHDGLEDVPEGLPELAVTRLMRSRARQDGTLLNFCGAGAYEHHIPAAVWEIATRGEFYSAYTPYQAEASQGTLQLLYEYQSMMCALTGMEVSNASMYDGASALAEALLMAARLKGGEAPFRVLMPRAVHPHYRAVCHAITAAQGVELIELGYDAATGRTRLPEAEHAQARPVAVVIPQPNFFGVFEDADALTDWAHAHGALAIALPNPLALALLKPPGQWGSFPSGSRPPAESGTARGGADICCGEGQPLGVPLSSGGPYFGFLTTRLTHVRQMPGRIVGRTLDLDGKPGYTLTLQAREQHIRRAKATSNICTNQGLLVTAATIHMALLGAEGLARTAAHCMANTRALVERLSAIPGVRPSFEGDFFHERALRLPCPAAPVLEKLARMGILGGYDLSGHYPELGDALLVCATETRTAEDLDRYAAALRAALTG